MTPVFQTKLYPDAIHSGNCFAACIASLLDLPLWMVPPWEDMFGRGDWHSRLQEWLNRFYGLKMVSRSGHDWESLPEFYMGSGLSPREIRHSVIYSKGQMVHDPHYSGAGIIIDSTMHLEPVSKA